MDDDDDDDDDDLQSAALSTLQQHSHCAFKYLDLLSYVFSLYVF